MDFLTHVQCHGKTDREVEFTSQQLQPSCCSSITRSLEEVFFLKEAKIRGRLYIFIKDQRPIIHLTSYIRGWGLLPLMNGMACACQFPRMSQGLHCLQLEALCPPSGPCAGRLLGKARVPIPTQKHGPLVKCLSASPGLSCLLLSCP